MKVTIKDVAKAAGVSPSTVSRALQNNNRISPEVRARVQQVAREMDFHPNQMARSLVSRQSRIIGIVFPSDMSMNLGNPFYPLVLEGLGHTASENHYHILLITGSESVSAAEASREAIDSGYVSGLITLAAENAPTEKPPLPMVVLGHPIDPMNCCSVDNDNVRLGYEATRYLLSRGHERILLVGYDERYMFTVDRRAGYEKALTQAGLSLRSDWIVTNAMMRNPQEHERLVRLFCDEGRPTAAVCMDDEQAIGMEHLLDSIGLKVPQDVSIIGVNNTEASRYHHPPLTTIDVHPYQLGVHAMNLMLDMLNEKVTAPSSVTVPFTLMERQSVADIR